VYGIQVLLTAC